MYLLYYITMKKTLTRRRTGYPKRKRTKINRKYTKKTRRKNKSRSMRTKMRGGT
jgi:hypothetical protein